MFRIPAFYQMPNMTFEQAQATLGSDVLAGMERINKHWERYANGENDNMYEDDDAWFDTWQYEVNAYNVVYSTMKPLFVGEAA